MVFNHQQIFTIPVFECLVLLLMMTETSALTQCSGETVGNDPVSSFASKISRGGRGYLLEDSIYYITCCGYVSRWEVYTKNAGTLALQVWRRTGTSSYLLVGRNEVKVTPGLVTLTVADADRIYVQQGDLIGWYTNNNMIQHETGSGYPTMNKVSTTITDLPAGSVYDWSSEGIVGLEMKFAIKAIVTNGNPQFVSGSPTTVSITDETAGDKNIFSLTLTDNGDGIVYSTFENDSPYFYVDTDYGQVKTSQNHIPEGTYTIKPMVTNACFNSATIEVIITVTNVPMTFDGLSESSATISVDDYAEKNLTNILITENIDGYYCYFTSDSSYPFVLRQANVLYPGYTIYLRDWPELQGGPSSYNLAFECVEASGISPVTVTGGFTVSVTGNSGPSMAVSTATVQIDAATQWTGSDVYSVIATDPENDPLTMTLVGGGPFSITDAGRIMLTDNVMRGYGSSYSLTATVTDTVSGGTDSMTISVTITNINVDPSIQNTVFSFNVNENEAIGTSVFEVDAADTDPLEYYAQFNPSYGRKYFKMNSTSGILTIKSHIDYDVISDHSIEVYVTVSDGKWYTYGTFTINIFNENETPVLGQSYYRIIRGEGVSGQLFPPIQYNVDDPDIASASDVMTFTKDCGVNDFRVSISSSTGRFSFAADYDLENPTNPIDFSCTVTVTDSGGLFDTCVVNVNVEYVNEFSPVFVETSVALTVLYTEVLGSIITTVHASDSDLSDHGKFYYELENTNDSFAILQNGSVIVSSDLSTYYPGGATFNIVVKAIDTGQRSSTIPLTITIPATPIAVIETTTEQPMKFFDYRINMAVYEILCVVCISCMCMTVYLVWKVYHTRKRMPRRPRPITPIILPSVPIISSKLSDGFEVEGDQHHQWKQDKGKNTTQPPQLDQQERIGLMFNIKSPNHDDFRSSMRSPD